MTYCEMGKQVVDLGNMASQSGDCDDHIFYLRNEFLKTVKNMNAYGMC